MPSSPGLLFNKIEDMEGKAVEHGLKDAVRLLMEYLIEDFDVLKTICQH